MSGLTRLASGLTADAAKILLDQEGGGYDRLHRLLERAVKLPDTRSGRGLLVSGAVLLRRLLLGEHGPTNPREAVTDVADDTFLETMKRIVEPNAAAEAAEDAPRPAPRTSRVSAGLEGLADFIVPGLGRKEKRR